jgi:CubicO group peptidase (beta-lactamase class C family)
MRISLVLLLFTTVLTACTKSKTEDDPSNQQKKFSQQQLQSAANYSQQKGGSGVLVMQDGQIVFESYHNGADQNTATHIQSGTKGFFAAVAALALQEGLITSYEENVSETITEWQNVSLHPGKKQIRVKHLVSLSSGLSQDLDYIWGENPLAPNIYDYVVHNLSLVSAPGSHFQYGPSHFYVFGVLLKRKLQKAGINQDPLQYLTSKILQPIGVSYSNWVHDQAGNPHLPNGCYITPRNWSKFGQLLLQKGKWNNQQLIGENFVKELFLPKGGNSGYGTFFWLNNQGGDAGLSGAPPAPAGSTGGFIYYAGYTDIIGSLGAGKNRLYIIPSLNAVIVRQTLGDTAEFSDNDFLELMLPK